MRGRRSQIWRAVGISLACHAFMVGAFLLALPAGRSSRVAAVPALDLKIPAPENFVPISFQFDDPPIRTHPKKVVAEPQPKQDASKNGSPLQNVTPAAYQTTSPVTPPAANNSPGPPSVGPLHGPLVRPGSSIVYVLDRSGSMAQDKKLPYAVALLKASLAQLGPEVRFQIVAYDSQAMPFRLAGNLALAPASVKNISDAGNLLDGLVAEGSSRHVDGLQAGLALQPDFLILLTDAGNLSSTDVKRIKQWNRKGTSIHAFLIGVGAGADVSSLREFAGDNVRFMSLPVQEFLMP
jgi:hypothetical protein